MIRLANYTYGPHGEGRVLYHGENDEKAVLLISLQPVAIIVADILFVNKPRYIFFQGGRRMKDRDAEQTIKDFAEAHQHLYSQRIDDAPVVHNISISL